MVVDFCLYGSSALSAFLLYEEETKNMTANEILNKYEGNLVMDKEPVLPKIMLELLKCLAYQEREVFKQYKNDKLWQEIGDSADQHSNVIDLPTLREILEKYKILDDEKDGM